MRIRILIFTLPLIGAALFALSPTAWAASIVVQQPLATQAISVGDGLAKLGTGNSGLIGMLQIGLGYSVAPTSNPEIRVICFTSATYATPCDGSPYFGEYRFTLYKANITADGQQRMYIATTSDRTLTMDATKYYGLDITSMGGGTGDAYGTSTKSSSQAYILWSGESSVVTSQINYQSYPTPNAITPTAFPTLSFNYTNADFYDYAGARVQDLTSLTDIAVSEENHAANGTFTYSETLTLTNNHFYTVTPYIRSSATGNRIYGNTVYFSTVSQSNNIASLVASTTAGGSISDCNPLSFSGTGCFSFLLVPDASSTSAISSYAQLLIGNVPPVSWGLAVVNGIRAANGTTSVAQLPSLTIDSPDGISPFDWSVDLTPWSMLLGSGTILSNATNPNTGDTIYEIVFPLWSYFIYFLFIMAFFAEFIGVGGKAVSNNI